MNKSKLSSKKLKKPSESKPSKIEGRKAKAGVEGGKSPQTMDELLSQVGQSALVHSFRKGSSIEGVVSSISGKEVLINFGGKMEGIVGEKEWEIVRDFVAKLKPGDKVTAIVISVENDKGQMIVSIKQAGSKYRWQKALELLKSGETTSVRGIEVNRGGLLVEFEGLRGFVPSSQLSGEHAAEIARMVNRHLTVKVIEVDQNQNRLVFSEKAVVGAEELTKKLEEVKARVKLSEKYTGKVSAIMPYGVFVNLDPPAGGCDGLVHISEISWAKVGNLSEIYKVGDDVEVLVLGISQTDGKLNLSIKQLLPDPWADLSKKYTAEQQVKGKVTKVSNYGVFVQLEEGLEGLIHISKVPAGTAYEVGESVTCTVESIDAAAHRISLIPVLKAKPIGYK